MNNIPIYRAKKNNSDKYVEGYYFPQEWIGDYPNEDAEEREEKIKHFISGFTTHDIWEDEENHFRFMGIDEIDPTTLAIHFPNMLAQNSDRLFPSGEKDLRIFASLQENGKGGDITELQASPGTCLSCGDKLPKTLAVAIYEEMEFREIELNPHKCFRKREHNYVLIRNLEYKKVIGIKE